MRCGDEIGVVNAKLGGVFAVGGGRAGEVGFYPPMKARDALKERGSARVARVSLCANDWTLSMDLDAF